VQYSICRSKKFKSVTSLFLLLSMKNNMISKIKTPLTGHQWVDMEKNQPPGKIRSTGARVSIQSNSTPITSSVRPIGF
jgi:hypothetical protein